METIPNSIRPMPTNTAGLSTYQGAQSNLTGSLLSLYGTQNASSPGAETLNPSQGKTPAAIEMFSNVEATRDGAERRHLETAIEQLTDGFFSLVVNIGTEDIPVDLFYEDIKELMRSGLTDVAGLFDGKLTLDQTETAGTLRVDPTALKGVEYRFNIDSNSTMKINKEKQLQSLERFVGNIGKFQNIFKDDPRIEMHPEKIAVAFGDLADIKGADEFVTIKDGPSAHEQELQQELQKLQQENQDLQQKAAHRPPSESITFKDTVELGYEDAANQMLNDAGLPGNKVQQPIASEAGVYNNPHVAAAADVVHKMVGTPSAQ